MVLHCKIIQYLNQTLGSKIKLTELDALKKLPLYLSGQFSIFEGTLFNNTIIFAVDNHDKEQTPAIIKKRMERIQEKYLHPTIYVRGKITAYNRQRLIQHKV
ncbi:MAG: hypothetical protein ABII18_02300, partial [bacterium]